MKHITYQTTDANNFIQILNTIHSRVIDTYIDSLLVNDVLGVQSPPIAKQEIELPRECRATLISHLSSLIFALDTEAG